VVHGYNYLNRFDVLKVLCIT